MQITRSTRMSEIKDEDFEPIEKDGKLNAPKVGERCLYLLRAWHGRPVKSFRVFGYREDDALIYVPLYKQSLSLLNVKGWIRAAKHQADSMLRLMERTDLERLAHE